MTQVNVVIATEEPRPGLPPTTRRVDNAWIYWWVGDSELLLRANADGRVLKHTTGPVDKKESYQEAFVVDDGFTVNAAFSTGDAPLRRADVEPQLVARAVKQSLSASLASLGPIFVPPSGKKVVTVLPIALVRLGVASERILGDEISLISTYPEPWRSNVRAEIKAVQDKIWHPGSTSFRDVANTPNQGGAKTLLRSVSTFGGMLEEIRKRPPNSIRRLNVFAHANPGLIGLNGAMRGADIEMDLRADNDVGQPIAGGIDSEAVAFLNFDETGKNFRDTELRPRFVPHGEILLFLCNGGLGRGLSLAQDLAQAFNVRVLAYSDPVGYYVEFASGRAERNLTSRGLVPDDQFESAKGSGRIAPGYPFVVDAPTAPQGLHLKPDRVVSKPRQKAP